MNKTEKEKLFDQKWEQIKKEVKESEYKKEVKGTRVSSNLIIRK